MPWENYIECADGQCAGAIFLDNGNGTRVVREFLCGCVGACMSVCVFCVEAYVCTWVGGQRSVHNPPIQN